MTTTERESNSVLWNEMGEMLARQIPDVYTSEILLIQRYERRAAETPRLRCTVARKPVVLGQAEKCPYK